MSHHRDATEQLVELAIVAPILIVIVIAIFMAEQGAKKRLADPTDSSAVPLEALPGRAALAGSGTFKIRILKQSGSVHSDQIVTGDARQALDIALSTFRRAGIDAVGVRTNTAGHLAFARLFYGMGPRGQMKGQKVGSASIMRVT